MMRKIARENTGSFEPGQDLVIAGFIALEGTTVIGRNREKELLECFSAGYVKGIQMLAAEKLSWANDQWRRYGATECESAGDGGILAALWRLSGAYETGVRVYLRQIPVKQETIEVCERYDLNPYRLRSDGCYLLAADNGGDLVRALKEDGVDGAVIGKVENGITRLICNGELTGYLERPQDDELRKIVPSYYQNKTN